MSFFALFCIYQGMCCYKSCACVLRALRLVLLHRDPERVGLIYRHRAAARLFAASSVAMFKRFSVDEHVGDFYRKMLDAAARERLTSNLARSLVNAPKPVQTRAIANFTKCDPHYGRRVQEKVAALTQQKKRTALATALARPS
ncbi:hypothetical protein PF003_g9738 [Phytophthora fragariae]|nr:hypothetical protein PF003_g9738 [Phytophthora fragariae]